MQSKWLFRWKIRATAFYLRRLGFKPLFRSQVKISLVLLSFLTFVLLTQLLSFRHHWVWLAVLEPRQAAHGYKGRGCSLWCMLTWKKKETWKGRRVRRRNSEFSLVLAIWKASFFLLSWSLFFFLMGGKHIEAELNFWLLTVKRLLMYLGSLQTIQNIRSFPLPTYTAKWMGKIIL